MYKVSYKCEDERSKEPNKEVKYCKSVSSSMIKASMLPQYLNLINRKLNTDFSHESISAGLDVCNSIEVDKTTNTTSIKLTIEKM